MKKILFLLIIFSVNQVVMGQTKKAKISTIDIDNFWKASDSLRQVIDKDKQIKIIQELYLDKATEGLKDFIELRTQSATKHLENIQKYPKFWNSVRPKTLEIKNYTKQIEKIMFRFKKLYPEFRQPDIYFTIGVLNSGGTTSQDKILIGSEIACSKNIFVCNRN